MSGRKSNITISTVEKRKKESDKAINTTVWLTYDKLDRDHVASLKHSMCIQLADKIQNLRASSFKDHEATTMHKHAMILFHKSRSGDVAAYASMTRAFSTLDQHAASKLKHKFEIADLMCKEGLAFTKMSE